MINKKYNYKDFNELYTAGCSYFGAPFQKENDYRKIDTTDRSKETIDYTIGQTLGSKLNLPVVEYGASGRSNSYIFRRTFNYLDNLDTNKKPIILLGLTELTRTEFTYFKAPSPDKYYYITPHDYHLTSHEGGKFNFGESGRFNFGNNSRVENFAETYYGHFYNDELAIDEIYRNLTLLSALCSNKGALLVPFFSFYAGSGPTKYQPRLNSLLAEKLFKTKRNFNIFNFGYDDGTVWTWNKFICSYDNTHNYSHQSYYDIVILADLLNIFIRKGSLPQPEVNIEEYLKNLNNKDVL